MVKILAFLELEQNWTFFKALNVYEIIPAAKTQKIISGSLIRALVINRPNRLVVITYYDR